MLTERQEVNTNNLTQTKAEMKLMEYTEQEQKRIRELANQIPIGDTNAVMLYGTSAQQAITGFSESMLSKVRQKETGEVGEILGNLMSSLHEVKVGGYENKGLFGKMIGKFRRNSYNMMTKYQSVSTQVEGIVHQLEQSKVGLMEDVKMLDRMYDENNEYLKGIKLYIAGGELKLDDINNKIIPKMQAEAKRTNSTLSHQRLQDMNQYVDRLEKRIHDLKLTEQIVMQSSPQIRMIQGTSQVLAEKIQSSIMTSIPLWKSQITIALALKDQTEAVKAQKLVVDTTNDLLLKNSEMLKMNTIETARENERSVVDVETLQKTQENLIETIEETMKIQSDGRKQRKEAEAKIEKMEQDLKDRITKLHESNQNEGRTSYAGTRETVDQKVNFLEM